jgi:hypothetical protein
MTELACLSEGIDDDTYLFLKENGYITAKLLATGKLAGISQFMFTYGLVSGITEYGYEMRWCYKSYLEALFALDEWDGKGTPPGMWIKEKGGRRGDRHGPGSPYYNQEK